MAKKATKNQGMELWIGTKADDPSSDTFTQVKRVTKIGAIGTEAAIIDATALEDSFKEKLKGIPDNGDVDIGGHRVFTDAGQNALKAAAADAEDEPYNFEWRIPGAGTASANIKYSFKAFASKFKDEPGDIDGVIDFSAGLAVTGAVTAGTYS